MTDQHQPLGEETPEKNRNNRRMRDGGRRRTQRDRDEGGWMSFLLFVRFRRSGRANRRGRRGRRGESDEERETAERWGRGGGSLIFHRERQPLSASTEPPNQPSRHRDRPTLRSVVLFQLKAPGPSGSSRSFCREAWRPRLMERPITSDRGGDITSSLNKDGLI